MNDQAHVVLLSEPFFRKFTKRQICDRQSHTENLIAYSCGSRVEVNGASFYDLDGHHWEIVRIAPQAMRTGLAKEITIERIH